MKIKVLYSADATKTVTNPDKTYEFNNKNDAKSFLIKQGVCDLTANFAIETQRYGYVCNGYDFLTKEWNELISLK